LITGVVGFSRKQAVTKAVHGDSSLECIPSNRRQSMGEVVVFSVERMDLHLCIWITSSHFMVRA
jgi:hypothetical protein